MNSNQSTIRADRQIAGREPRVTAARIAKRIGIAVVGLVMALGVTVGLSAAPAQAKTMFATLDIDRNPQPGGMYLVSMDVWLPMNEYDAHGYYNNGARIQARFWADDSLFDPVLALFANGTTATRTWFANNPGYTAESDGIHLRFQFLAPGRVLDEDPAGWLGTNYQDEIYFTAIFTDGDGVGSLVQSNVATGYFCCG
ncbi:hypothetical protein KZZ52_43605 [Dactylosporangium sp. AC04546]|uniref:hypothetical protein n=1 Tax=Dactylosporangium sp. AC04546 TaxID=2862460 RepID=UPI001EDDA14A|nr:hypothetical protein [Dactylosporangium sp. AC04546]WVK80801.1 hypothetical protein KZZ52_43605 [Dactylosporangium sp. AC04546]